MLVLTRKCQQSVVIDGCGAAAQKLTVTVLEIRGDRVKLGIKVSGNVPVHRSEVWARINGNAASESPKGDAAAPRVEAVPEPTPSSALKKVSDTL